MVSLELGKEIGNLFYVQSRASDKEKTLSSHEESNLRPSYSTLRCSTNDEPHVERGLFRSSYSDTRPAYCQDQQFNSVMFVNGIKEMASFELGKEIEKGVFRRVTSVGLRKILSCLRTYDSRTIVYILCFIWP